MSQSGAHVNLAVVDVVEGVPRLLLHSSVQVVQRQADVAQRVICTCSSVRSHLRSMWASEAMAGTRGEPVPIVDVEGELAVGGRGSQFKLERLVPHRVQLRDRSSQ